MPNTDNPYERLIDRGSADIKRTFDKADKLTGNPQPVGTVRLNARERADYFRSQPPERQQELWGQMDASERQEIEQGIMGNASNT